MIGFTHKGNFDNLEKFLKRFQKESLAQRLERYGQEGVNALQAATPKDSGTTANSWTYKIESIDGRHRIYWINTHTNRGVNIAIILQYGHGTGTGGYVAGQDYINPTMRPVFDRIAEEVWREVTKL